MRAPLIAVISVGIAAAAPAVAVSADQDTVSTGTAPLREAPAVVKTNLHQPIGPVTVLNPTKQEVRHRHLQHRFLKLRNKLNRLVAKRDRRKARVVHSAVQLRWSERGLRRASRTLRKRIRKVRAELRNRRAGLTPGVRSVLERIAACESRGNPRAVGGGGAFRGKYQFTFGTWQAVGGKGDPAAAPEAEQDRRAAMLLTRSGSSPWPVCG